MATSPQIQTISLEPEVEVLSRSLSPSQPTSLSGRQMRPPLGPRPTPGPGTMRPVSMGPPVRPAGRGAVRGGRQGAEASRLRLGDRGGIVKPDVGHSGPFGHGRSRGRGHGGPGARGA